MRNKETDFMKKIIKFFKLKFIEKQLSKMYERAVMEAEFNDIKYRSGAWHDHPFLNEVERLLKEWHKVRYDN